MVQTTALLSSADIAGAGGALADALFGTVYTGLVASKCRSPFAISAANKQWGGRLGMRARDDMSSFQIIWPNWRTNGNLGETGTGAPLYINASVEYPLGTRTQVLFGGAAQGVAADLTEVTSDAVLVNIPRGAKFWIHVFCQNANGMLYVGGTNTAFANFGDGDTFQYAPNGLADLTMAGNYGITDANGGFAFPPIAVIGATRRSSVALVGDSRWNGINDRPGDAFNHHGEAERSIGPFFAFSNMSQASETANTYNGAGGARRRALVAKYFSHVVCNYGINDMGTNTSAAKLQTLWDAAKAASAAANNGMQKLFQATLPPVTTSTVATTAASSNLTVASVTIPLVNARALKVGQTVTVAGITPAGYNGSVVVNAIDTATGIIQYTLPAGGSGLGNATVQGTVSDLWASLDFQTPFANEAERVTTNTVIRRRPAPVDGVFDIADVVENVRNGGKWNPTLTFDGIVPFDGLHDTSVSCQVIAQSSVMGPVHFRRGLTPIG